MKRSVLSFGSISYGVMLLLGAPAIAGVQDIYEMQQQNNGTFRVICTNQQTEIVNSSHIINNQVCTPIRREGWRRDRRDRPYDNRDQGRDYPTNRGQGRDLLACRGNRFLDSVYLVRLSDDRQLGGNMTVSQCEQALDTSRRGLVCTGNYFMDNVAVTRISDGQTLSRNGSLVQCQEQIRNNNY